jgi:hypothetical protein
MIRISKATRLTPAAVMDRAARFFGPQGEGLEEVERGDCCIRFVAADGHVTVRLVEEAGGLEVDVESREYEYASRRFLDKL